MLLWTGKWHRRSNCMTGAEWQVYRFGPGVGASFARLLSAVSGVIFNVAMLAYLIKGAGLFLSMFMPFSPTVCALIMVVVTMVYTLLSGFYGVVYTDLFQCGIILAAVVVVSVMAWADVSSVGGGDGLAQLAAQVTGSTQWTSSVPHWRTPMPPGYEQYSYLAMFAFFYLITNIKNGISSGADSRYFGARNERDCGLLSFFWTWLMMFRWPMMIGFAVMGLLLVRNLFSEDRSELRLAEAAIKDYVIATEGPGARITGDKAAVAAQVAAIMPQGRWGGFADDVLNRPEQHPEAAALRQLLGDDWKQRFQEVRAELVKAVIPKNRWEELVADIAYQPSRYPKELIDQLQRGLTRKEGDDWIGKLHMVSYEGTVNPERILPAVILFRIPAGLRGLFVVALLAAAMSTFSPTVNATTALFTRDIYQAFLRKKAKNWELIAASYGFGFALTVGGFVMAYYTKNINHIWGWIIMGLGSGNAMPGVLRLYWWRFNPTGVVMSLCIGVPAAMIQRVFWPDLDERLQFLILMTISFASAVIGTYIGRPVPREVVEHFYKTTRPFGLWGPFKNTLSPEVREATRKEHFYDLVAVPFVFFWQVTLFLLPMQLIIRNMQAFWVTLVIFVVSLYGVYRLWYKHLPPAQAVPETIIGASPPAH